MSNGTSHSGASRDCSDKIIKAPVGRCWPASSAAEHAQKTSENSLHAAGRPLELLVRLALGRRLLRWQTCQLPEGAYPRIQTINGIGRGTRRNQLGLIKQGTETAANIVSLKVDAGLFQSSTI